MRQISTVAVTNAVAKLCVEANKILPPDLTLAISEAEKNETNELPKSIMHSLVENISCAQSMDIPVCQDTGMAIVFVELGQGVQLVGGGLNAAINEGVRQGYVGGALRCSVVADPLLARENTGDNTPAIIHTTVVDGDGLRITVAPKGFGSENMSALKMFTPAATKADVEAFVLSVVQNAAGNPCPPIVVGVGIGGSFEYSALLAKKALCRSVSESNSNKRYAEMEAELLHKINELNIGPQGFGGKTTALAVNIETFATHIAGLPVAVNIGCHVTRHSTVLL